MGEMLLAATERHSDFPHQFGITGVLSSTMMTHSGLKLCLKYLGLF